MVDERFEDERSRKSPEKRVVLQDGREFTHRYIINRLARIGVKSSEMEEVFCKLLKHKKIFTNLLINDKVTALDTEKLIKILNAKLRAKSQEVSLKIDGVSGESELFINLLEHYGMCISFK